MKTRLSQICIAITMFLSVSVANAQQLGGIGGQQSAFQSVSGDLLQPGLPGRLWLEANFADEGLGYTGSYLTIGGKTRLFQDRLDGRWLFEGQVHQSIDNGGGFFANVGLERVFSIPAANADVSVAAFYDYDGDDQQDFSDGFNQLGVSAAIKTPRADLITNGYFPVGTDAYTLGDVTGVNCFVGNNIALQAGLESALQGFDMTLRTRPKQLAFANGYIDFGGYHYNADLVDSFAGGRLRVGVQLINSLRLAAEINQDERFDTTGALNVSWTYGNTNSGHGSEYAGLARDLEKYARNDHIVRFSQDLVVAVNPLTGQPINVIHANNLQLGVGDGSDENPFATLAEAEAASSVNDVIFVDSGDGTDTGYQNGIALQDGQQLLSGGGSQFVQNADGTLISLTKVGVGAATISNVGGNEVVSLANNNVIGGINIDATGATYGVFGNDVNGFAINETSISGAALDGVNINNASGNLSFTGNTISVNGQDGVFINGSTDVTSNFVFTDNQIDSNAVDGLHIADFEAASITIMDNSTDSNARHGIYLENALNGDAAGTDIAILTHSAVGNGGTGIFVEDASGRLQIVDTTATDNGAAGLRITNFTNPLEGDFTLIGSTEGIVSQFNDNAIGIDLTLLGDGLAQNVLVTLSQIDNNSRGIQTTVDGVGTILDLDIIDNTSISNNEFEGILLRASGGSTLNNQIVNIDPVTPLQITGNNTLGGNSLSYVLTGDTGDPLTEIISIVRDVNITSGTNNVDGINVLGTGNSRIDLDVADSTIDTASGIFLDLDNDNNGSINRAVFDNVVVSADFGITLLTSDGTNTDFSLTRSIVQSNGILGDGEVLDRGSPEDFGPFTDNQGDQGIVVSAFGGGFGDNLTRVNIANSEVNNFTFEGIDITGSGDAQLLVNIEANQINRNGPGLNNDPEDDDSFEGNVANTVDPTEEFFHSGIEISAFGTSVVSGRIVNNSLVDNFERAIQLNTAFFDKTRLLTPDETTSIFDQGTINVLIDGNRLASNIGLDDDNGADPAIPPVNNFLGQIGVVNGLDANVCIDLTSNIFENVVFPIDIVNFNVDALGFATPGSVRVGLDEATNGFTADTAFFFGGFTEVPFGTCIDAIEVEELSLETTGGFTANDH